MKRRPGKKEASEVELGTRYKCYKCGAKFYDLGRAQPLCPSCGEDQNNEETKRMLKRRKKRRPSSMGKADVTATTHEERDELHEMPQEEGEYSLDIDDIVLEEDFETEKSK